MAQWTSTYDAFILLYVLVHLLLIIKLYTPTIILFSSMRKDLHEDPKFKEWQETVNKELQRIIESDDTKSYEKIFTELGGLEMPNSTDCGDKLENLIKQVVDQKLCESQNEFIKKCIQYFGSNSQYKYKV